MPSTKKSHEKAKKKKRSKNSSESSSDDDMNLKKELHPIGYYINDRAEMIRQVFKVIKGNKLRAMMTSQLRDLDMETLKTLCLEQLEGMSKKRILHIIAGKELEESSDTDEDGSESDPAELNDSFFSVSRGDPSKRDHDRAKKCSQSKNRVSSDESTGEGSQKLKRKKTESASSSTKGDGQREDSKKKMELLELEMRARAIKSLLNVEKEPEPEEDGHDAGKPEIKITLEKDEPEKVAGDETRSKENGNPAEDAKSKGQPETKAEKPKKSDEEKEAMRKAAEEEKRLQKAREALLASEAKKRDEEEALERKHAEIRKKLEDELKRKKAEEELAKKKADAEAEKARRKAAKEAEYQKFLKWKEEKLKREREEDDQKARENLRRKASEMKEKELRRKYEREQLTKSIEMRKRKINRECVEDDLDRSGFESSHEKEESEPTSLEAKKRRYRKKGAFEDGELVDDDVDSRSDLSERSRSPISSRSRSYSRSPSRSDSGTPTLSESDEEEQVEKSRKIRQKRVREIRDSKKKRKRESDIEDGEVDSEGETFEPICEHSGKRIEKSGKRIEASDKEKEAAKVVDENEVRSPSVRTGNASADISETKPDLKPEESPSHDEFHDLEDNPLKDFFRHGEDENEDAAEANVGDVGDAIDADREEQKRVDKMGKLREMRLRRMQAFQARTEIQEEMADESSESEEDKPEPANVPERDFYKSFLEEEKRRAEEEERKRLEAETKPEVDKVETPEVTEETKDSEIKQSKKRKNSKEKEKSSEEKLLEGVAYWSKICAEKGDFETPDASSCQKSPEIDETLADEKEPEHESAESPLNDEPGPSTSEQQPQKDVKMQMTSTSKVSPRKSFSKSARLRAFKRAAVGSDATASTRSRKDLPTKQEVDADQELDNVTWADRWFQNSKVQKVVKDSKMLSKVRTSIRVKLNKPADNPSEDAPNPGSQGSSAVTKETDASLPAIIGSLEEYAKIVGKSVEAIEEERVDPNLEGSDTSDEELDEGEDDGLWGTIMGAGK